MTNPSCPYGVTKFEHFWKWLLSWLVSNFDHKMVKSYLPTSGFCLKPSKKNTTGCNFLSIESFKQYKWEETWTLSQKRWFGVQDYTQKAVYCHYHLLQKALRNFAWSEESYTVSSEFIDTQTAPNTLRKNKCTF